MTHPVERIDEVYRRIEADSRPGVWITLLPHDEVRRRAAALAGEGPDGRPLWGVPFAVKDNIDVAGLPTTAACPARTEQAPAHAPVVARLLEAGAILVGKTNLDQFATGLTGTRSPYGIPSSVVVPGLIAGGSSSGSAVAVGAGYVDFALGTDTAGSGRVPAACNGIVGLKPTRGIVSTSGVVPACRSIDCVSIFASTVAGATAVLDVVAGVDDHDPFSRRWQRGDGPLARLGVPRREQWEFFGDEGFATAYAEVLDRLADLGHDLVEIELAPFVEAGRLLYGSGLVAERLVSIGPWLAAHPEAIHPVVAEILRGAERFTAADVHAARHRLAGFRRSSEAAWEVVAALALPTIGTTFTIDEALADPIGSSMTLGHYTNFVNLLDLCAVAVPAGARPDGVPFGVTFVAPAHQDLAAAGLAGGFRAEPGRPAGIPTSDEVLLVVAGAHMRGQPLEHQLLDRGGCFRSTVRTAPCYRLYALPTDPPKPGLVRVATGGAPIEAELWSLPVAGFGSFVAGVPAPMVIGKVHLADGSTAPGFLCEPVAAESAPDITATGGWRSYRGCEAP